MSSAISRLFFRPSGTSPSAMRDGEAFDDGGLADARLTDQDGVVLAAPREHLDAPADLLVAPDDRVDLSALGERGEVLAVLLERGELLLGALVGDTVRATNVLERSEQLLGADVEASVHREQQVLDGQEVVSQVLAVLLRVLDDVGELLAHLRLGTAVGLRELLDCFVGAVAHHQRGLAQLGEHRRHDRALLAHHRAEHVIGRQFRVGQLLGLIDGGRERLLGLQRPFLGVDGHGLLLPASRVSVVLN